MKAPFRITRNVFLCGLNRSRHTRFSFFANLALFSPSSSEDETMAVEGPVELRVSAFDSFRNRKHVQVPNGKYTHRHAASNISCIKYKDIDMELVKLILVKQGWNFYDLDENIASLSELTVIQALNHVFWESSNAALALHFFRWLECRWKLTVRSVCLMVYILISGNMNYRAVDLLSSLVREEICKDAGYNSVFDMLEEICSKNAVETAGSMLVKCYIMEEKSYVALDLVTRMEHFGIFPSKAVCSMLVKSLLRSGKEDLAWDFMERVQRWGMENSIFFTLFIDYHCKKGNIRCGWKILMEMRNYGLKPDVVSFTIVVDFLCKRSCLREATSILFKMVGMGIPPDSVLLSSVIDGYCKAEMAEEALRIVNLFSVRPNLYMYNSFLTKFCKDGDMVGAANVFQELLHLGLEADCFSYTTMIGGYCKIRDVKSAHKELGKMLKKGVDLSVTTYTVLIGSYCESGDIKTAARLFQTIKKEGLAPDLFVYNIMIDGYGKKGYLREALKLLSMMELSGVSPDVVTYNSIIQSLVISGYLEVAKDFLDGLIKRGFPIDRISFTHVIGGLSNKGQFEEASLVWSCMKANYIKPDVVTCSAILNGYCRARHMDKASSLFSNMINAGLIPDLILYNTMIHGFCSVGNITEACCLISSMIGKNIMPNHITYDALVLGYEKNKFPSPSKYATFKLQQIFSDLGLHVEITSVSTT